MHVDCNKNSEWHGERRVENGLILIDEQTNVTYEVRTDFPTGRDDRGGLSSWPAQHC